MKSRGYALAAIACLSMVGPTLAGSGVGKTGGAFVALKIGGGGFVTRTQIYSDGTQIARTDTSGAYIRNNYNEEWRPLLTVTSMPSPDNKPGMAFGVCEIVAAPSDTNVLYMYFAPNIGPSNLPSYVYKSTNKGASWARTDSKTFPRTNYCYANDPGGKGGYSARLKGSYMDVSPANPDVMYVGTLSNGVYYTLNGGTSYAHIPADRIPAGTTPAGAEVGQGNLVAFDPSDSTGNTVYISSYGNGVWKCTSAKSDPSCSELNSPGMPLTFTKLVVAQDGVLWVVNGSEPSSHQSGDLLRYKSGIWSTQIKLANKKELACVAINPRDANKVYASDYHGFVTYSTNAENEFPTWSGPTTFSEVSSVIGWMQWSNDNALSIGWCQFDPTQTNVLYASAGVGIFNTSPPTRGTLDVAWNGDQTRGIENLDATAGFVNKNGQVILNAQDRPIWTITDPSKYPLRYYPNNVNEIVWGTNAGGLGNTVLGTTVRGLTASIDGGNSYGNYINTLDGNSAMGGNVVAFDRNHWIWLPANIGPYFTNDGGVKWSSCTFTPFRGVVTSAGGGWFPGFNSNRYALAQDATTQTTTLLWNDGMGSTNGLNAQGIWESNTGTGCNFTQVYKGAIGPEPANGPMILRAVPGKACNFYFSPLVYVHGALPDTSNQLFRSTDCGATWSRAIYGVESIFSFTFGAPKPGENFPTFYCACWANDGSGYAYGIFESDNINSAIPAFTKIGDGYPAGSYDLIMFLVADLKTYGTLYGGFYGSGFFYRTLN